MSDDESLFWLDPPNPIDQLPADLKPGDGGDIVTPPLPQELLNRLELMAWRFDRMPKVRDQLDELMDVACANLSQIRRAREYLVVRGDSQRLRTLTAINEDVGVVLRQVQRLRDALRIE